MSKTKGLLFAIIMMLAVAMAGCGSNNSKYSRNPNYTYGELGSGSIEDFYKLTGEKTQGKYEDYSDFGKGSKGSYYVTVSETSDGGVVAYGEGIYVYSSDKKDKKDVGTALFRECKHNRQN